MLTQEHVNGLQQLADACERAKRAAADRDAAIEAARRVGVSWAQIAVFLGVSKQAAAKRHTPRVERRDRSAVLF